jgi:hypothetical protein
VASASNSARDSAADPHRAQNRAPVESSNPHEGQNMRARFYHWRGLRSEYSVEKSVGGQNTNPTKWIENQQVRITRNNVRGITTDCKFEEFVVLRIAANRYLLRYLDPLGFTRKGSQKIADILFIDVLSESPPAENVIKFRQRARG